LSGHIFATLDLQRFFKPEKPLKNPEGLQISAGSTTPGGF
jgi:hypothetical protein